MGSKQSIEDKTRASAIQSALNTWDNKSIEDTIGAIKNEIDAGMDVNQRLASGNTLLTSICSLECNGDEQQRKRLQLFQQSLDMGANINTKNRLGDTPLIIAAKSDDTNLVQSLLTNGANAHDENKSSFRASQIGSASGSKVIEDWVAKCSQEIISMFARVTENQSESTIESIKPFMDDRLGWIGHLQQEKREKYEDLRRALLKGRSGSRNNIKIDAEISIAATTPRGENTGQNSETLHVVRKILNQKEYLELDSLRIDVKNRRRSFRLENIVIHKSLFATEQAKRVVQGEEHIMELLTRLNLAEDDKIPFLVLVCNTAWVDNERWTPRDLLQEIILPGLIRILSFERLPPWYERALIEWMEAKTVREELPMI